MLSSLVLTDLRTRYKGSVLGFLWTFLNPLLMLIVYTFVFSNILRANIENYPMFLFVAILPWIFFQSSVQNSINIIIRNGNMVKKIYFPREVLPISAVAGGAVNYLFGLMILIPALLIFGISIKATILLIPVILLIQSLLTLGISFAVAALNVYFRDVEHIVSFMLQLGFYVTPIIFPVNLFPEKFQPFFKLNPLTGIMEAYRDVMIYGKIPEMSFFVIHGMLGFIVLIIGWVIFYSLQKNFADEL
jgi:ABC-2 type transport system permease protein